jgi:hypothetical protein
VTFSRSAGEGLRAGIDLDTAQHTLARKKLGEPRVTGTLLAIVSSCIITPLIKSAVPGEANNISR